MTTTITYADIKNYLTAIAAKNGGIDDSPHGAFWQGLDRDGFVNGSVPGLGVPIMNTQAPLQSNFFVILTNSQGIPGSPEQMPAGGPFVTDQGYTATLPDGTTITGAQIIANMKSWLTNGYPA